MNQRLTEESKKLSELCNMVRRLTKQRNFSDCERVIAAAMSEYPHAPQPHNLMGVLFKIKDDPATAMKHFRAACSLDPSYTPVRHNLHNFASLYTVGAFVFDETDLGNF